MKTEVYLIRHGESLGNLRGQFQGQTDWDLTELGYRQAACAAKFFDDIHVDAVYASDLCRAFHTAEAVAARKGLQTIPEPGFREISAGVWEGRPFTELRAEYPESYEIWRTDIGRACPDGGESVAALYERVRATLDRICAANPGKTLVVGTHAVPIRVLMTVLGGRPIEDAAQQDWVSNASVTKLCWVDGTYTIEFADAHDHLGDLATTLKKGTV